MNPIPSEVWDALCDQAKEEIMAVLATFDAQAKSEVQSQAFAVDLSHLVLELLQDEEDFYLEDRWCD